MKTCFGKFDNCEECEYLDSCKLCSIDCDVRDILHFVDLSELPEQVYEEQQQADETNEPLNLFALFKRILEVSNFNADRCMVMFAKACGYSYSEIGLLLGGKSKQMIGKHVKSIEKINKEVAKVIGVHYRCTSDTKLLKLERRFDTCVKRLKK